MRDPLACGDADNTPLDPDEAAGLRLSWVATRADLDAAEQVSITTGLRRRRWRRPSTPDLLDDLAVRDLHRDLFAEVWTWAGLLRRVDWVSGWRGTCTEVDRREPGSERCNTTSGFTRR